MLYDSFMLAGKIDDSSFIATKVTTGGGGLILTNELISSLVVSIEVVV
jgi:hypothetical protein